MKLNIIVHAYGTKTEATLHREFEETSSVIFICWDSLVYCTSPKQEQNQQTAQLCMCSGHMPDSFNVCDHIYMGTDFVWILPSDR